ncbi:MAG: hypothetical protein IPI91_18915 [Flavobacteriales bacterium]|nr:hypothetical protein [Flavobacteriales bacterium]
MISGTCNSAGATCLGFVGNGGTTDRSFTAVGVPAATTVHIYVTTWPAPDCVASYDLVLNAGAPAVCGNAICEGPENFANCPVIAPAAPGQDCTTAIDVSAVEHSIAVHSMASMKPLRPVFLVRQLLRVGSFIRLQLMEILMYLPMVSVERIVNSRLVPVLVAH